MLAPHFFSRIGLEAALSQETKRKIENALVIHPAISITVALGIASAVLGVSLWLIPGSAESVAIFLRVDLVRSFFPLLAKAADYTALRYGGPWDVFLLSIFTLNAAFCVLAALFFAMRVASIMRSVGALQHPRDEACLAQIRVVFLGMIALALSLTGILALFMLQPNDSLNDRRFSPSILFPIQHFLMICLSCNIVMIVFLQRVKVFHRNARNS